MYIFKKQVCSCQKCSGQHGNSATVYISQKGPLNYADKKNANKLT